MSYMPPQLPIPTRLLGIDAGGSATRVVLISGEKITRLPPAPPMNALLTPDLVDRVLDLIRPSNATAAGIGLPGLRAPERAAQLARTLTERAGIPVYVKNDGQTACLGAFEGKAGIAVFAGTGSGATGWDGRQWARAGGHGFLLGDEGSAYWLGRTAVNAALRWADGMGGSATIHSAVTEFAGCTLTELVREIHTHSSERSLVTRFAPLLTSLASADAAALSLAREGARHLAELALAVRRKLGPLPVSGMGGVLGSPVIWDEFVSLTGAVRPLAPPEIGAALLASGDIDT
ncbi:MAG: N-acetylglucosamine kinase [Trebonia sp.]